MDELLQFKLIKKILGLLAEHKVIPSIAAARIQRWAIILSGLLMIINYIIVWVMITAILIV